MKTSYNLQSSSTNNLEKMNPAPLTPVPHVCVHTLKGHQGPIYSVRFNRKGEYCLTAGSDKTVRLWNPHKGTMIGQYKGHGYEVYDAQVFVFFLILLIKN